MENGAYRLGLPLCEGAAVLALTQGLSCVQLHILPEGGAASAELAPLIWFALRRGPFAGFLAGGFCGLARFAVEVGAAPDRRLLAEYLISWAAAGFAAGLLHRRQHDVTWGPILGMLVRWLMLVLCGVYLRPETVPERFMQLRMVSPWAYFPLYYGVWLGPSLVLCLVLTLLLAIPLRRFFRGEDLDKYAPLPRQRKRNGEALENGGAAARPRRATAVPTVLEPEWDPVREEYVYRSARKPETGSEGSRALGRSLRDAGPQEPEWDPVREEYVYRSGRVAGATGRPAVRSSGLMEPVWDPEREEYVYRSEKPSRAARPLNRNPGPWETNFPEVYLSGQRGGSASYGTGYAKIGGKKTGR